MIILRGQKMEKNKKIIIVGFCLKKNIRKNKR